MSKKKNKVFMKLMLSMCVLLNFTMIHSYVDVLASETESENGLVSVNDSTYWYENGVLAQTKEMYDAKTDAWYYVQNDGTIAKDQDVFIASSDNSTDGKWVRLDKDGKMVTGKSFKDGNWYYFDLTTRAMVTGFVNIPTETSNSEETVYFDPTTGKQLFGEQYIDGNWYYFDLTSGEMAKGFVTVSDDVNESKTMYYDPATGKKVFGEQYIDGVKYDFDEKTGALDNQSSTSSDQITVNTADLLKDSGNIGISLAVSNVSSTLYHGLNLSVGGEIMSPNGQYEAILQGDGNFVIYENTSDGKVAHWATDTAGAGYDSYSLVMQEDGNLVLYGDGQPIWASNTAGAIGSAFYVMMQDDGNLVIYNNNSDWVWCRYQGINEDLSEPETPSPSVTSELLHGLSLNIGGEIASPSGEYEAIQQADGNFVVYHNTSDGKEGIWASGSNNQDCSSYTIVMQEDGNLVIYGDGQPLWATDTAGADGSGFYLRMQDDGNLVIYNNDSQWIWCSYQGINSDTNGGSGNPSDDSTDLGTQVVNYAEQFLGVPYKWEGTTPSGFDCSGFTQYVYAHFGISIPRNSAAQASAGTAVSYDDVQVGDLVCYSGHVAIYVGDGEVIHSPTEGDSVKISPINMMVIKSIRRLW